MADGSDDPADLVRYHRLLEEGYDCAFGSRFVPGADGHRLPAAQARDQPGRQLGHPRAVPPRLQRHDQRLQGLPARGDRERPAAPLEPLQPHGRAAAQGDHPRPQLRGRPDLLAQPRSRRVEARACARWAAATCSSCSTSSSSTTSAAATTGVPGSTRAAGHGHAGGAASASRRPAGAHRRLRPSSGLPRRRRHPELERDALAAATAWSRSPRRRAGPVETIVVDNGSTDGSLELLARATPGVRVVALGRNTGFAFAANRGVEAADSDAGRAREHRRRARARLARADGRGARVRRRRGIGRAARWWTCATRRCSTTPATCCAATERASSAGASSATTAASTSRARCSARAPAPPSTGARRCWTPAASTSASSPTSRTWTSRCGCGWRAGAAATSRRVARHAGEGSSVRSRNPLRSWVERNTLLLLAKAFPAALAALVAVQAARLGLARPARAAAGRPPARRAGGAAAAAVDAARARRAARGRKGAARRGGAGPADPRGAGGRAPLSARGGGLVLSLFVSYSGRFGGAERLLLDCAAALDGECVVACPEGPLADSGAIGRAAGRSRCASIRSSCAARPRAAAAAALRLAPTRARRAGWCATCSPDLVLAWGMRSAIALGAWPLGGARPPRTVFQHNDLLPGPAAGRVRARRGLPPTASCALRRRGARPRPRRGAGARACGSATPGGPGALLRPPTPARTAAALLLGAIVDWKRPRPRARGGRARRPRAARPAPARGRGAARRARGRAAPRPAAPPRASSPTSRAAWS